MGRQDSTVVTQFVRGLDVSHHQGEVNWRDISLAGNVFAYVKTTEGTEFVDDRFSVNWMGMKDAGIIRGAYHFFRPSAPVEAQVKSFLTTIGTLGINDLPPVLDLEEANTSADKDEWEALPVEQRMPLALEWLRGVEQALGRKPMIYTRSGFVKRCFGSAGALSDYPLWIAHYTDASKPAVPVGWTDWTIWQYSSHGQVKGINSEVDMDRFNGSHEELMTFVGRPRSLYLDV